MDGGMGAWMNGWMGVMDGWMDGSVSGWWWRCGGGGDDDGRGGGHRKYVGAVRGRGCHHKGYSETRKSYLRQPLISGYNLL